MEIKAIDIGPIKFCVVASGDAACAICQQPIRLGKLGAMNEELTAFCCWECIGKGIEESVAKQAHPLVIV